MENEFKGYEPSVYKVITIDGVQFLTYKGEKLPLQIETTVHQVVADLACSPPRCVVTVKVFAELVDTK
jgi:hypothetical protein